VPGERSGNACLKGFVLHGQLYTVHQLALCILLFLLESCHVMTKAHPRRPPLFASCLRCHKGRPAKSRSMVNAKVLQHSERKICDASQGRPAKSRSIVDTKFGPRLFALSTPSHCPRLCTVHAFALSTPSHCPRLHTVHAFALSTPLHCPRLCTVHAFALSTPLHCPRLCTVHAFALSTPSHCPQGRAICCCC